MAKPDKKQVLIASAAAILHNLASKSGADESAIRLLAAGSYGVVYIVPSSSPLLAYLNFAVGYKIQNSSNLRTNKMLTAAAHSGAELIVKMSQVKEVAGNSGYDYFNGFIRENVVHIALCHKFWNGVVGAELVPEFFFSGGMRGRDGVTWYVTVMEMVKGKTLKALLAERADGKILATEYVLIERAVLKLWLLGVVHADLHMSNIMYDVDTNKVTILDFGFAVPLPEDVIKTLRKNCKLLNDADVSEVYDMLHGYVESTIKRRMNGIKEFNTDGLLLRRLNALVKDPDNVVLCRQRLGAVCRKIS